jgi:DNA polymerase-3 subunit epsilon
MAFKLERDIVFFDIEATGLSVIKDRIVQIALIKYKKDGSDPIELSMMINPAMPISEEAMAVHGITPEMVRNKPTFQQVAAQIFEFIGNADLSGYNSDRYDIPMLLEEFARSGYDLDMNIRKTLDVQKIFYKMEPRTLSAAYKLYCKKQIENAHDALADVRATVEVLQGMIKRYEGVDYTDGDGFTHSAPISNDLNKISEFTGDAQIIDVTRKLKYDAKGDIVFNFGKYQNQKVLDVLLKDKQYYNWILNKDFSVQVKQTIKRIVDDHYKQKKQGGN